ncbi:MAG: hypothetical protein ACOZDY_03095 [Pseudomonadota bacterium]
MNDHGNRRQVRAEVERRFVLVLAFRRRIELEAETLSFIDGFRGGGGRTRRRSG